MGLFDALDSLYDSDLQVWCVYSQIHFESADGLTLTREQQTAIRANKTLLLDVLKGGKRLSIPALYDLCEIVLGV